MPVGCGLVSINGVVRNRTDGCLECIFMVVVQFVVVTGPVVRCTVSHCMARKEPMVICSWWRVLDGWLSSDTELLL